MPDRYDQRGWLIRLRIGGKPKPIPVPGRVNARWWMFDPDSIAVTDQSLTNGMLRIERIRARMTN